METSLETWPQALLGGPFMYMLDLEIYSLGNGDPCKNDQICVLESSFLTEDEDRSQCHKLKLLLIF